MAKVQSVVSWFGQQMILACDGRCKKAWGVTNRPKSEPLSSDPDDYYLKPDSELGEAPADPGSYEGGKSKPASPRHNRWCRACERSVMVKPGAQIQLPNLGQRLYNQPWKHEGEQ